jgi:hypothetical protein
MDNPLNGDVRLIMDIIMGLVTAIALLFLFGVILGWS